MRTSSDPHGQLPLPLRLRAPWRVQGCTEVMSKAGGPSTRREMLSLGSADSSSLPRVCSSWQHSLYWLSLSLRDSSQERQVGIYHSLPNEWDLSPKVSLALGDPYTQAGCGDPPTLSLASVWDLAKSEFLLQEYLLIWGVSWDSAQSSVGCKEARNNAKGRPWFKSAFCCVTLGRSLNFSDPLRSQL